MSITAAVTMFCGPHDEGEQTPTRRIDHAIRLALTEGLPLFIAGDAFGGNEIRRFQARAWHAGVDQAFLAFDPGHCTLSDAQAVGREIIRLGLELTHIHLVTDWWHMERARQMLERELLSIVGRQILVIPELVMTGPRPHPQVHLNESQGLEDYLAGRYGQRTVIDPLYHGPELPL